MRWREVVTTALGAEGAVEALSDLAMERIVSDVPLFAADADLLALTRASTLANLQLIVLLARGSVELENGMLTPQAAALTRELARRNVPITELARAYRIVQHAVWKFGVDLLRGMDFEEIESYTDSTFLTGEALTGAALERYTDERSRWSRSADALRRETVVALLSGGDDGDAEAASRRLRFELRREHVAFVCGRGHVEAADASSLEAFAAAVGGGPGALVVAIGEGVVAGWCAPAALDLSGADDPHILGVGTPGAGLAGFRRSHHEAIEARRVALLLDRSGPTSYDDVALLALLTRDEPQARRFAARVLGGLNFADPVGERLGETLEALYEEGLSPRRAAARLGVHENTVAKRVRTIEGLIGRPITTRPAELLAALQIARARRG